MSKDDNDDWYLQNLDDDGGEGEGEGSVGETVQFRYKDAASLGPRDDMLPPQEIQRLITVHRDLHKARVDKQKSTRKERQAWKEGKKVAGLGHSNSHSRRRKKHILDDKAQYSGMDPQMTTIPAENNAKTNEEMRNDLENRYTNKNVPRFNPRPRYN